MDHENYIDQLDCGMSKLWWVTCMIGVVITIEL